MQNRQIPLQVYRAVPSYTAPQQNAPSVTLKLDNHFQEVPLLHPLLAEPSLRLQIKVQYCFRSQVQRGLRLQGVTNTPISMSPVKKIGFLPTSAFLLYSVSPVLPACLFSGITRQVCTHLLRFGREPPDYRGTAVGSLAMLPGWLCSLAATGKFLD